MKKYIRLLFLIVLLMVLPLIELLDSFLKKNESEIPLRKRILKKILINEGFFSRGRSKESNFIRQRGKNEKLDDNNPSNLSTFISDKNISQRKKEYLRAASKSNGLYAQCAKIYQGQGEINKTKIHESIEKINNREDTADFDINALLRMMNLDRKKQIISKNLKKEMKEAILNFKYWFSEPGSDNMIFWTENHMILFHTAELLAGQLFPSQKFTNNGWSGEEHREHARSLVLRWLDWRAKFGFGEWHSNIYYLLDLIALLNLVDFAENKTISNKAEMLIDLIGFDFINNFYKDSYATAHGRTVDELQLGISLEDLPQKVLISDAIWVLLGYGIHNEKSGNNSVAAFLATSKYTPPKILRDISYNIINSNEYIHKSRNNIDISQGPKYEIKYQKSDLMFWWGMSAPAASPLLELSLKTIERYDLNPKLVYNNKAFVYLLKIGAILHKTSLNKYSELINDITQGVALESANTYTYKTPYYQLSGVQDHQKGMNGLQELIWQACLDENATFYTSSPSALSTGKQQFTSGWKPRATLYKNVGIIQYDRDIQSLEIELVMGLLGEPSYTHAYYPRWALNEWNHIDHWVFGRKHDSYIALYSYVPCYWKNEYELRADGKKNVWIVELGSENEFGSYKKFKNDILNSNIQIAEKLMGFNIIYNSPSQGLIQVDWESPLYGRGQKINLGPYDRFENRYCNQKFGEMRTKISFQDEEIILDFKKSKKNKMKVSSKKI